MFRIWALALCLAAAPALAQSPIDLKRPFDPGDPAVKGPAVDYRSVFGSEKPPPPDVAWPAANDEMAKLKGHAGHIRDAEPGGPAAGAPPAANRGGAPHHQH